MSYRIITDNDKEQAKEKSSYCTVCNKMKINNELMYPVEALAKKIFPKQKDIVVITCLECRKKETEKEKNAQTIRVLRQTGLLPD